MHWRSTLIVIGLDVGWPVHNVSWPVVHLCVWPAAQRVMPHCRASHSPVCLCTRVVGLLAFAAIGGLVHAVAFAAPPASCVRCNHISVPLPEEWRNSTPFVPAAAQHPGTGEWVLLHDFDQARYLQLTCADNVHAWGHNKTHTDDVIILAANYLSGALQRPRTACLDMP